MLNGRQCHSPQLALRLKLTDELELEAVIFFQSVVIEAALRRPQLRVLRILSEIPE